MTPGVIEVRGLERSFGARRALAGVELSLAAGEIVGLVGPNGSGKTTLLRILAGFLRPDAGSVRVLGLDPWRERERVMERARFAFAPPTLLEGLTAREHLRFLASLGRGPAPSAALVQETLVLVGLEERADERVGGFSFGMRQRLALAQALLPRPELLVLDEPTEGLDPLAVLELRGLLARLVREHGLALLLSSHLLVEIDELVDEMVVLVQGEVRFAGTPADLRRGTERLVLAVSDPVAAKARLSACGLEARASGLDELELPPGSLTLEGALAVLGPGELRGFWHRSATLEQALLAHLAEERRA